MARILSMILRRVLMRGLFATIARVFGRGRAQGTGRVVRGVRRFNRFSRRR